jgi:hypothetical protein
VDEDKDTVTHSPSVALVPNLILNRQLRSVALSAGQLTLSTVDTTVTSRLEWQRVSGVTAFENDKANPRDRSHWEDKEEPDVQPPLIC